MSDSFVYIAEDFDIPSPQLVIYDSKKHRKKHKKVLVMSGGGIKGIAHLGVLQALQDTGHLHKIEEFVGTSVGALILGMYVLGYTPRELWHFVSIYDLSNFKDIDISNILLRFGIDSGKNVEFIIKKFIQGKGLAPNITLRQLYGLTKKKFVVSTVCVNTQQICYISYENFPDLPVHTAIRMSIAIPIYYTPVVHENLHYIDGGCMDNFPIGLYKDRLDEVIGAYLVESKNIINKISNLEKYISLIIQCLMSGVVHRSLSGYEDCTIRVNMESIVSFNYDITQEIKTDMFRRGYKATMDFLQR